MIGAQVVIGDQAEPFLGAALHSVEWVDYYAVVHTAPETPQGRHNWETVLKTVPEEKLRWHAMGSGLDFAAARNAALDLSSPGDYVLILDADEVHFPEWEGICKCYLDVGVDSITAAFYHLVVYRDAVQAVFPREIVFRKYPDTQFVGAVHEKLYTTRRQPVNADYRYMHYSYIKPQREVFTRWKRYSDMVGDTHHYDGQSPDHIIDDRVSVATRLSVEHPPAVRDVIDQYPVCPVALQGESKPESPQVGLALLKMPGDDKQARDMWATLAETKGTWWVEELEVDQGISLATALNTCFRRLLSDGYEYIGWIHPDMRFGDPEWLTGLLHELRCWPKIGKVCAANTRDTLPGGMIDGHEQCYLIRSSVLREIGLFDEGYVGIGGYEDWDMNMRVLNAGYRVVITPRSRVFHEGMATRSRRDTTAEAIANAEYFRAKWGSDKCPV
jgi:hypothetical protein